ncbi:hypothetical protein BN903_126 [Halorubrum sp. AJ67]|nr:hypothetical protein BN903_126 [Halorubrum sp. AJ67]
MRPHAGRRRLLFTEHARGLQDQVSEAMEGDVRTVLALFVR